MQMLITDFLKAGGLKPISEGVADDLFITCASFEPRSKCLTDCMVNYLVVRAAIYVNREFQVLATTAANYAQIESNLKRICKEFLGLTVGSWEDAADQFRALRTMIAPNGISNNQFRITLDITTFNREALFACLSIIRWAYPYATVRLAYVSPKEYNPVGRAALQIEANGRAIGDMNPAVIQEYVWLSRGFRKMRNAIGFAGFQKPNLPALLILLPGYEVERPLTLVDNLEPSLVFLGKPIDSTKDEFFERSVQSKEHMVRLFKARQPIEEFEFSCKSIEKAVAVLRSIVEKYYDTHNIFLTSLSTKLSIIAVFLLAEKYEKVQVTSSVPGEYNVEDYSSGSHEIALFVMPNK